MEEKTKLLSILDLNEKEWSTISSLKKIPFEQLKQRDLIEADIDDSDEEDSKEIENQE